MARYTKVLPGKPETGYYAVGDVVVDGALTAWECVVGGFPGQFVEHDKYESYASTGYLVVDPQQGSLGISSVHDAYPVRPFRMNAFPAELVGSAAFTGGTYYLGYDRKPLAGALGFTGVQQVSAIGLLAPESAGATALAGGTQTVALTS